MTVWKCLHLYADAQGVSRVNPDYIVNLPELMFAPPAPSMFVKSIPDAHSLAFIELRVGWEGGWHPSPREQWVICLGGEMGYEAGDGTTFTLTAGSCIWTTDTIGRGHHSWTAGAEPVRLAVVQV